MRKILQALFGGCRHRNIGTPVTILHKTTVLCRNCKQQIAYDWSSMTQGEAVIDSSPKPHWRRRAF